MKKHQKQKLSNDDRAVELLREWLVSAPDIVPREMDPRKGTDYQEPYSTLIDDTAEFLAYNVEKE